MSGSVTSIERKGAAGSSRGLSERVVLQFGKHVIRGFADPRAFDACMAVTGADEGVPVDKVLVHAIGSPGPEAISLQGLKAAFFVKRFDGPGLDEMRFHDHLPAQENLWVRITFRDGEVMEGLVDNQAAFLVNSGFLLKPIDPDANHWLVFVAKAQIQEFHILGLRAAARS